MYNVLIDSPISDRGVIEELIRRLNDKCRLMGKIENMFSNGNELLMYKCRDEYVEVFPDNKGVLHVNIYCSTIGVCSEITNTFIVDILGEEKISTHIVDRDV